MKKIVSLVQTKKFMFASLLLLAIGSMNAQIKIGENIENIDSNAILEMESTSQGVLFPRMTSAQRDSAFGQDAPTGLFIFNTDVAGFQFFHEEVVDGTPTGNKIWSTLQTGVSSGSTNPATVAVGDVFYNTANTQLQYWDGSAWIALNLGGGGTVTPAATNTLTLVGTELSISNGNTIDLASLTASLTAGAVGPAGPAGPAGSAGTGSAASSTDSQTLSWGSITATTAQLTISDGNSLSIQASGTLQLSGSGANLILETTPIDSTNLEEVQSGTGTPTEGNYSFSPTPKIGDIYFDNLANVLWGYDFAGNWQQLTTESAAKFIDGTNPLNAVFNTGSVGIGNTDPDPSAALEITSTTQGFLPPRMVEAKMNAISSPQEALMVYCLDCVPKGIYVFDGSMFAHIMGGISATSSTVLNKIYAISASGGSAVASNTLTLAELQSIGITDTVTSSLSEYQTAIGAATFANDPPTIAEVQAIIDAVNASFAFVEVLEDSQNPPGGGNANTTAVSFAQLQGTGATGLVAANLLFYQVDLANHTFTATDITTMGNELQVIIDAVNTALANGQREQSATTATALTTVVTFTSASGQTWMDRNLGAASTGANGDYYQWGRLADGHQFAANTLATPAAGATPGHADFITTTDTPVGRWSVPFTGENDLWDGLNGQNNPCPPGYQLPTAAQMNAEIAQAGTNLSTHFLTNFNLSLNGYRTHHDGTFNTQGQDAYLWTSSLETNGRPKYFTYIPDGANPDQVQISSNLRATGMGVRCIKN